jgi:uncharacterized SAM-binding protein YcdF (DUF218 family)
MIQKSRIFWLLGINTIVLYSVVLFLIPGGNTQQLIVIGIAMALMMIAPNLIINVRSMRWKKSCNKPPGSSKQRETSWQIQKRNSLQLLRSMN